MSVDVSWRAVKGDVFLPAASAGQLGDALALLVTAIHHPEVLDSSHKPNDVARDVIGALEELKLAAQQAEAQETAAIVAGELDAEDVPRTLSVTLHGSEIRFAPGSDFGSVLMLLDVFARAVLVDAHQHAHNLQIARGAIAYSAVALVKDLQALTADLEEVPPGA